MSGGAARPRDPPGSATKDWPAWVAEVTTTEWVVLGAIILVGSVVRVGHLDLGMRYDEAYTVWRARARYCARRTSRAVSSGAGTRGSFVDLRSPPA